MLEDMRLSKAELPSGSGGGALDSTVESIDAEQGGSLHITSVSEMS